MALPSITYQDFIGYYKLSADEFNQDKVDSYINEFYPRFVREIIGVPAWKEINDETDPLAKKWTDLFDGTDYYNTLIDSLSYHEGLRKVILGFVYFYYVREFGTISTTTGLNKNKNGNSTGVNHSQFAISRYNQSVEILTDQVYPFIKQYEYVVEEIVSSSEVAGLYTINVIDTTYLSDGDIIVIGLDEYTASNVVENTSFEITAPSGIDFSGEAFSYTPFNDFPMPKYHSTFI